MHSLIPGRAPSRFDFSCRNHSEWRILLTYLVKVPTSRLMASGPDRAVTVDHPCLSHVAHWFVTLCRPRCPPHQIRGLSELARAGPESISGLQLLFSNRPKFGTRAKVLRGHKNSGQSSVRMAITVDRSSAPVPILFLRQSVRPDRNWARE